MEGVQWLIEIAFLTLMVLIVFGKKFYHAGVILT